MSIGTYQPKKRRRMRVHGFRAGWDPGWTELLKRRRYVDAIV
jgi:ribosomal protein L34